MVRVNSSAVIKLLCQIREVAGEDVTPLWIKCSVLHTTGEDEAITTGIRGMSVDVNSKIGERNALGPRVLDFSRFRVFRVQLAVEANSVQREIF
jgi:hypothetical protein